MGRKRKNPSDCSYRVGPPSILAATVVTPTTCLQELPINIRANPTPNKCIPNGPPGQLLLDVPISYSTEMLHECANGSATSVGNTDGLISAPIIYERNHRLTYLNPFSKGTIPVTASCGTTSRESSKRQSSNVRRSRDSTEILKDVPTTALVFANAPSCVFCKAKRMVREPPCFCCSSGQVKIAIHDAPDDLWNLFTGMEQQSKEFKPFARTYNNIFACTSFGVTYDKEMCRRNRGVYTFKAQGQVYHQLNPLTPSGEPPSFLQLYFYDTDNEVANRMHWSDGTSPALITRIMDILRANPYCQFFRSLTELPNLDSCRIVIRTTTSLDQRIYNAPTSSQVAAIWVEGNDGGTTGHRDILVQSKSGIRCTVKFFYGCYDPLQYVLLFPFGEPGWHQGIKRAKDGCVPNSVNQVAPSLSAIGNIEDFLEAEETDRFITDYG